MERTVKVTGTGKLSVSPDTTRLLLIVDGKEWEYRDALEKSAKMTDSMKGALEAFGFERKDLKTLSFGIDAVYESYQTKERSWKQRFDGYKFTHRLKLQFPVDSARLGKVLYALGHCEAKPEIRIEYTVAEPDAVKNELLAKAAEDSRAKAEVLARTAGAVLGEVLSIDYSWGTLEFVTRPMDRMLMESADMEKAVCAKSIDLDIEPDDIDVTDTVTMVWHLQ